MKQPTNKRFSTTQQGGAAEGKPEPVDSEALRRQLADPLRLLRAKDLAELFNIHKMTVWSWRRKGVLPKPKKLTGGTTVWLAADLAKWLANK